MAQRLRLLAVSGALALHALLVSCESSEKGGAPSPILFRDVSLIDGTGAPLRRSVSVLVVDRRIRAVGSTKSMVVPENVRVLDGRGKYLLPGFWDMHVHLSKIGPSALGLFVVNGVTSVRDMGSDFSEVSRWREEIVNGVRPGPRIKTPGPFLEDPANIERMKREGVVEPVERTRVGVPDPRSAERIVRSLKRKGVDFIKIRTVASHETYLAIAKAAQETQLPLTGHVFRLEPEDALRAKQRSIEHFFFPTLDNRSEEERNKLFNQFAENGTVIVPTLATWTTSILVPAKKLEELVEDSAGRLDKRRRYVSRRLIEDWREQVAERKEPSPIEWAEVFPSVLRDLREMHRAGMKILPGSDVAVVPVFPGFSLHEELELLVSKVGMTPMEALLSAHRRPAEFFGMQHDLGTVEVGKLADLVLLDDNPLQDIRNTRRIRAVVANGSLFRRADLNRIVADIEAEVTE